ncbi:MAG: phosphocholine cytidylyltransferase family protein [Candidatus Woesearchaeota archaeon]
MKAIILAAGIGKRMYPFTKTNHKATLDIAGKSLIERDVDALIKAGFNEIVIVVGYLKEQLINLLGSEYHGAKIIYVENHEFTEKGNLNSLYLAKDYFKGGFIMMDADLIFDYRIITELMDSGVPNALLVGRLEKDSGEEVKVYVYAGKASKIGKKVTPSPSDKLEGEAIGIVKYSDAIIPHLIFQMENMMSINKMAEHEDLSQLICNNGQMGIVKTDRTWMEIDFPEEVKIAREIIFPKIYNEEILVLGPN